MAAVQSSKRWKKIMVDRFVAVIMSLKISRKFQQFRQVVGNFLLFRQFQDMHSTTDVCDTDTVCS
jgi:hypothetical protein